MMQRNAKLINIVDTLCRCIVCRTFPWQPVSGTTLLEMTEDANHRLISKLKHIADEPRRSSDDLLQELEQLLEGAVV